MNPMMFCNTTSRRSRFPDSPGSQTSSGVTTPTRGNPSPKDGELCKQLMDRFPGHHHQDEIHHREQHACLQGSGVAAIQTSIDCLSTDENWVDPKVVKEATKQTIRSINDQFKRLLGMDRKEHCKLGYATKSGVTSEQRHLERDQTSHKPPPFPGDHHKSDQSRTFPRGTIRTVGKDNVFHGDKRSSPAGSQDSQHKAPGYHGQHQAPMHHADKGHGPQFDLPSHHRDHSWETQKRQAGMGLQLKANQEPGGGELNREQQHRARTATCSRDIQRRLLSPFLNEQRKKDAEGERQKDCRQERHHQFEPRH